MGVKSHYKAVGTTDTWITPKYITDALGRFDLDPCAHTKMPWTHATTNYTIKDDGLKMSWGGARVWLNPPFNQYKIAEWMKRMSEHKNGIMLISAALETQRFYDHVWGKATGILAMDHRPYFCLPNGKRGKANSGQSMCLISYDEQNLQYLIDSKLGVVLRQII